MTEIIAPDSESGTFGEWLSFLLFVHGSRPTGSPQRAGERWTQKEFADGIGKSVAAVGNWLKDGKFPEDLRTIERVLFGSSAAYDEWRTALRSAHRRGQQGKKNTRAGKSFGEANDTQQPPPTPPASSQPLLYGVPSGRAVVGREEDVARLRVALGAGGSVALTNGRAVLKGQGGIGKTTLARAYADDHGGDYAAVFWCLASDRRKLVEELVGWGTVLGLQVPEMIGEPHAKAVLAKAQEKAAESGRRFLFVYDNVETADDLKGLTPNGQHLILTTRQGQGWPGYEVIETQTLDAATPFSSAVELLLAEAGRVNAKADERAQAWHLAQELGGLPLALVVAAGLIRDTGEGFAAYRGRLDAILAATPPNEDYPSSVMGAVKLSYDALPEDAKLVADLFAWWSSEGLSAELITGAPGGSFWRETWVSEHIPAHALALAQYSGRVQAAIIALRQRSLVFGPDEALSMHQMTQAALRGLQESSVASTAAVALLAAACPPDPRASSTWKEYSRLAPHLLALWASRRPPVTDTTVFVFNQVGLYLNQTGDRTGHLELMRASRAVWLELSPIRYRDDPLGLANLGLAEGANGNWAAGELLLDQAIAMGETYHSGTSELAAVYSMQGFALLERAREGDLNRLSLAIRRIRQALVLDRHLHGRQSEQVANSLSNLAGGRDLQGRTGAASRLASAAYRINKEILPSGDARLAFPALSAGFYRLKMGRTQQAEPTLRVALQIFEAAHAERPRHEHRVLSAISLISCLLVRARCEGGPEDEARRLCEAYGFDFGREKERARQYPCSPAG